MSEGFAITHESNAYCPAHGFTSDAEGGCAACDREELERAVIDVAVRFIEESGSATVDGRVRWVGDCYVGGELSGAVSNLLRARAAVDALPRAAAEKGR